MIAIKAHFDGKALIPEGPVELPRDKTLVIHVEPELGNPADESFLRSVIVPSDPAAARRLIQDVESGVENF